MKIKIQNFFKKIPFTEKILLIFMSIIYIQIIYNLCFNEILNSDSSAIDTIIRTAASSIFGYFLGSKLETHEDNKKETKTEFIYHKNDNSKTIIISLFGLISLLILLFVRNFLTLNATTIASISQLKDIFSASVGFLVSQNNSKK